MSADGAKGEGWGVQTCTTTFMDVARNTSGMDVLVQAIQRAGLADALPSPGAGLTVFAPTNAAFLAMMQALRECPLAHVSAAVPSVPPKGVVPRAPLVPRYPSPGARVPKVPKQSPTASVWLNSGSGSAYCQVATHTYVFQRQRGPCKWPLAIIHCLRGPSHTAPQPGPLLRLATHGTTCDALCVLTCPGLSFYNLVIHVY